MAEARYKRDVKRDERGKFVVGTAPGPGRPPRHVERDYLTVLGAACPLDRWRKIVEAAVERAEAGDPTARQWLSRYLLGDKTLSAALTPAELHEQRARDLAELPEGHPDRVLFTLTSFSGKGET